MQLAREPEGEHGPTGFILDAYGPVFAGSEFGLALVAAQHLAAGAKGFEADGV